MRRYLTTGDVAKICGVAPRTASRWIDTGEMPGYRLPGGSQRRVEVEVVRRFLISHQMPVEWLDRYIAGKLPRKVSELVNGYQSYEFPCNDGTGMVRALLGFLSQTWPHSVCESMLVEEPAILTSAYLRTYVSDVSYTDVVVYMTAQVAVAAERNCTTDVVRRASVSLQVVENTINISIHSDNQSVMDWIMLGEHGFTVGELVAPNHV